jgi:membrane protein implicated in regulation of membrane protease activity
MAWIYFGVGLLCLLLELVVPGGVVFCLGLSSLVVSGLIAMGYIEGIGSAFMACSGLAVAMIVPAQMLLNRFSDGKSHVSNVDEDSEAFGQVVTVIEAIEDGQGSGRIRYQGSDWPAISHSGPIPVGGKCRIMARDNLVWVVEPHVE